MYLLQNIYIMVLSPLQKLIDNIDCKTKDIVLSLSLHCMIFNMFMYTAWANLGINVGYAELLIINTAFLAIAIVCSLKEPLKKVEWNGWIVYPWMLCCAHILISGLHHSITSALMFSTCVMLLIFPCLFFVWNNRGDYETLYYKVSKAMIHILFVYFAIHLILFPVIEGAAYYGIAVNPNSNGLLGTAGIIASLYLIMVGKKKQLWLHYLSLGVSFALTYISASRASFIAIMMAFICFCICIFRLKKQEDNIKEALKIIAVALIVVMLSATAFSTFLTNVTPSIKDGIVDNMTAEASTEEEELEGSDSSIGDKFNRGDNLNDISSGRIVIWQAYLSEMNLIGNERGDRGLYVAYTGKYLSAHNSYLEIGYRCGIFAGLLYAYIALYAAVYSFKGLFGKKVFSYSMTIIPMAVMAFGVLSNLERALYPLEKVHILFFFLAFMPIFVKQKQIDKEKYKG